MNGERALIRHDSVIPLNKIIKTIALNIKNTTPAIHKIIFF